MINVIRLHGDPHKQVQGLLPWYANGTLEPEDVATVEAHLADCAECRAELDFERAMTREISGLDADNGWTALRNRIASEPAPSRRRWPDAGALLRRQAPLGWTLAAQAAALALVVLAVLLLSPPGRPVYRTLGAPAGPVAGNVIVKFSAATTERDLRAALTTAGARLVDGPTAGDAYVLHAPSDRRDAALSTLRSDPHVTLAEPIEGDARP